MSEHTEQVALFQWAGLQGNITPELKLMFAIPNGGHRHKAVAAKMKAEGVKAGVPDVCLPVARGGYFGLYIEMKVGNRKASDNQKDWLNLLHEQGYRVDVCNGFDEALALIRWYMSQPKTKRQYLDL